MPDEQPRVSEKLRIFIDGEPSWGKLTVTDSPRDGMLCTVDGKVMKFVAVVYNDSSGEIDEIYLEEVEE